LIADIPTDTYIPNPKPYVYTNEVALNLTDCRTAGAGNSAPASSFDENGTGTFKFARSGQKLFIRVPSERVEDIQEAQSITINIQGSSSISSALFRCSLALPTATSNWNGTEISNGSGASTGVVGSDFFNKDINVAISSYGKDAYHRLGFLMIQMNSNEKPDVTISSITITINE
jgi:hypothetical protein